MKVGLIIPYSGLINNVAQEIEKGFRLGLAGMGEGPISFVTEFVEFSNVKKISMAFYSLDKVQKVDMIIVAAETGSWTILKKQLNHISCAVIFLDLAGEEMLGSNHSNIFINSLQLSQSTKIFREITNEISGKKSEFGTMTFFKEGIVLEKNNGDFPEKVEIRVSTKTDYDLITRGIRQMGLDHLHIIAYSYQDFNQLLFHCLSELRRPGLVVSFAPFFAETDMFKIAKKLNNPLYTASSWFWDLANEANVEFVSSFHNIYGSIPENYALLAYEVGLLFNQRYSDLKSTISIQEVLSRKDVSGPRGQICLEKAVVQSNPIYISKLTLDATLDQVTSKVILEHHFIRNGKDEFDLRPR